ncbi:hypothetical protein A2U01_0032499, partial [Trifolium medium]|nr:hypothetical protein [Trifolium medium]
PKSLLLGIGVMTLGLSPFVEEDVPRCDSRGGTIYLLVTLLRGDACSRGCAREMRGIFVEDNDDVFERRKVSLIGLEETNVSSAAATCTGYERRHNDL